MADNKKKEPNDMEELTGLLGQTSQGATIISKPVATVAETQADTDEKSTEPEVKTSEEKPEVTTTPATTTTPKVVEPTAPVATPSMVASTMGRVTHDKNTLVRYMTDYLTIFNAKSTEAISSPGDKQIATNAIKALGNVVNFICRYPEFELLEMVIAFYKQNKSGILNPKNALKGIDSVDETTQTLYVAFYTVISGLAEGRPQNSFNVDTLKSIFEAKSPEFYSMLLKYFTTRNK